MCQANDTARVERERDCAARRDANIASIEKSIAAEMMIGSRGAVKLQREIDGAAAAMFSISLARARGEKSRGKWENNGAGGQYGPV